MFNFYQFSSAESSVNDLLLWTANGTPWHFLSATSRMTRTPHAGGKESCIPGTRTRNLNTHVKWIHRGPSTRLCRLWLSHTRKEYRGRQWKKEKEKVDEKRGQKRQQKERRGYYMRGTWKGWESDRSSPLRYLLYVLCLSFSFTFFLFSQKQH